MTAVVVWSWVVVGLLRTPWILAAGVLLCVWIPAVEVLKPFPSSSGTLDGALELAAPAGLLGACAAMTMLSRHGAILERVAPLVRWSGEFVALLLATIVLQLPTGAGFLLAGGQALDFASRLPDILTADALFAGIALLLLIPSLSTAHRALLFLSVAWFFPALCPAGTGVISGFVHDLEVGAVLRARGAFSWPHAFFAAAIALLGFLLRTRPGHLRAS